MPSKPLSKQKEPGVFLKKSQVKKPVNHHDMFFKSFYSDPAFALELFQFIFNKKAFNACDWKNLKEEKDSLEEKRADLVFSVPLKARPKIKVKIFILLEHKSYYDPELFSQLLYYQTLLHEHSLKTKGAASPIIPVVFYHGKTPWKWARTFQGSIYKAFLSKIPVELREYMIDYKVKLLDAQDPKLKGVFKNKSFKSRGALYLLRRIWDIKLTRAELKEVLVLFSGLPAGKQNKLIVSVSDYLQSVLKAGKEFKNLWQAVERELVEKGIFKKGGYMDTLQYMREREQMKGLRKGRQEGRKEGLQKGLQKGLQEGHKEGRQEMVRNMLREKLDVSLVSKVAGIPVKEVRKIKNGS